MHKLYRIIFILSAVLMVTALHKGRTDANGGHYDHSTGEYHYHHGYPAHDHYDMDGDGKIDCPYEFKDKTNHSSNSNNNNNDTANTEATNTAKEHISFWKVVDTIIACIVLLLSPPLLACLISLPFILMDKMPIKQTKKEDQPKISIKITAKDHEEWLKKNKTDNNRKE